MRSVVWQEQIKSGVVNNSLYITLKSLMRDDPTLRQNDFYAT